MGSKGMVEELVLLVLVTCLFKTVLVWNEVEFRYNKSYLFYEKPLSFLIGNKIFKSKKNGLVTRKRFSSDDMSINAKISNWMILYAEGMLVVPPKIEQREVYRVIYIKITTPTITPPIRTAVCVSVLFIIWKQMVPTLVL